MKRKAIRYIIENIVGTILFTLLKSLPLKIASNVGGCIARKVGPYMKVSKVADHNITKAMPEKSKEERQVIIKNMWENLGRTMAEFPHIARMKEPDGRRMITVEGKEYLEQLHHDKMGGFLVSGHIANWELIPLVCKHMGIDIGVIYRSANNPYMDKKMTNLRSMLQKDQIAKGKVGARKMLKLLGSGGVIAALVDQKMNDGMESRFFGHKAMTAAGIPTISLRNQYAMLPIRVIREREDPHHFTVKIYPPMTVKKKTKDSKKAVEELTQEINTMLEEWIREYPEQWFWVHKRWNWNA